MILFWIICIVLICLLVTTIILLDDFKYYKMTYDALVSGRYKFKEYAPSLGMYRFTEGKDSFPCIMYFVDSGDIKLYGNSVGFLHNSIVTYLNPYALYWYIKLRKWFKREIERINLGK